jgi:hypothetical protein
MDDKCVLKKINAVVPAAPSLTNVILTTALPFIVTTDKQLFLLEISDVNKLVQDQTATISVNDTVNMLPLVDPRGYNIRADRITKRAERMCGGIADNPIVVIKCAVATDPARIIDLTPLRRSGYDGQANTAGTVNGTGINGPN